MKYAIVTLFVLLTFSACSKKESNGNLHITGNIKGLKKGTLYIQKIVDTALMAIDTIEINGDSHFSSDLDIQSPEMYYLFLDRGITNSLDNNLSFFAEAGSINIETSLEYFNSDAKITGSKNQEKYEEYKKIISRFTDENLSLMELYLDYYLVYSICKNFAFFGRIKPLLGLSSLGLIFYKFLIKLALRTLKLKCYYRRNHFHNSSEVMRIMLEKYQFVNIAF